MILLSGVLYAQNGEERIDYLATFGNMSGLSCVDNDFSQTIFIALPANYSGNIYFRVFDPDCGGMLDMPAGHWETNTIFEIYGGEGSISDKDARSTDATGNYKSGTLLTHGLFARENQVDETWVSFGPFHAKQGEIIDEYPGYTFFKMIVEGRTGDDINIYSLFISSSDNENIAIDHASFFDYERTVLREGEIRINRVDDKYLSTALLLPVDLDKLTEELEYSISVEPVEE